MENDQGAVTLTAGSLLMRPWGPGDIAALVRAYDDPAMRLWLRSQVADAEEAARWLDVQRAGWESGDRFGFAVTDTQRDGELVGHLALKRSGPASDRAEVGYWTTAAARGRGVAPRALGALTDWAFLGLGARAPARLELLHHVDNEASCRVAEKCGYALAGILPALPPDHLQGRHLHVRHAPGAGVSPAAGRCAESAGTAGGRATPR
ncbi:GNAT family N-acetyltransferase [Streptomyces sp. NPDC079020]|uniref:GNAT family N-acetyltransferase n=1 Tax=unclassified Streptomyces TaxID=2593676 RepID=UPI00225A085D|nr:GNAT family N-acetyltransferase [Streptomyces sp. NBC_00654]MCX4969689.1 GNAT family N-acetyltransferase [Streptomyces sp. NBC_00654]